jgi:hypothetical protein
MCTVYWMVVGELKDSVTDGTRDCVICPGQWMVVGRGLKDIRTSGQGKSTGDIKNSHKISFSSSWLGIMQFCVYSRLWILRGGRGYVYCGLLGAVVWNYVLVFYLDITNAYRQVGYMTEGILRDRRWGDCLLLLFVWCYVLLWFALIC